MLECLAKLARAPGGEGAAGRLAELAGLFETRLIQPNGALPYEFTPDWRPLPPLERTGYLLQGSHRLMGLARAGMAPAGAATAGHRMLAHALAAAWDARRGGFREIGSYEDGAGADTAAKCWWDQWEGLRALFDGHDGGARPEYEPFLRAHWRYIDRLTLDRRHGGTFWYGLDGYGAWQRWARPKGFAPERAAKGEVWKDASHEARALMHCAAALRRRQAGGA